MALVQLQDTWAYWCLLVIRRKLPGRCLPSGWLLSNSASAAGAKLSCRSCRSKVDLSYLGRVHVSKQVLANSMYFHASFMLPSQELLAGPVECIDCFVAKGHSGRRRHGAPGPTLAVGLWSPCPWI
jgi:hypothetical protein